MASTPTIEGIREDFSLLESWEDRYGYVIELGRALPALDANQRTEANKVRGCASQVWLSSQTRADTAGKIILHFEGDSDAQLVRGLVAILLILVQDRDPASILAVDANAAFVSLGLGEHLTPQRSNGFASMVARVRADARASLPEGS
jgi:cysteine desulfuration protein SufE